MVGEHDSITFVFINELQQRAHKWPFMPTQKVARPYSKFPDPEEILRCITEDHQTASGITISIEKTKNDVGIVFKRLLFVLFVRHDIPKHVLKNNFECPLQ